VGLFLIMSFVNPIQQLMHFLLLSAGAKAE
jgi:hypothetical protein